MGEIINQIVIFTPVAFVVPLLAGWLLDKMIADPAWLPHPIILFGNIISKGEKALNKGNDRKLKGAVFSVCLIFLVFTFSLLMLFFTYKLNYYLMLILASILIFYCLAGTTLVKEVRQVFLVVDKSVEAGRKQVARIVGRDTSQLNPQQIRTAALETLAENLSDGVIAPLFWLLVLGIPGMLAYKMINTLDSMIGYKNDRYKDFGCWAAKIDDVANYIPARITAVLMLMASGCFSGFLFVKKYGEKHASPNSGYPESALAAILDCQFGGPNVYFDKTVDKPYIGDNPKELNSGDMKIAVRVNQRSDIFMVIICIIMFYLLHYIGWI